MTEKTYKFTKGGLIGLYLGGAFLGAAGLKVSSDIACWMSESPTACSSSVKMDSNPFI